VKKKIALLVAPRRFEIAEEEISPVGDDELLIKIISSGLCHSDVPAYLGESAQGVDELGSSSMRPVVFPHRFGHEAQGIVEEVGKNIVRFKPGDYVTGLIKPAYASYAVVDDSMVFKLPPTKKDPFLCIGEPLMCVVNIVRAACPEFGDTAAVVGCGSMGLLTIAGLTKSGAKNIVAVDLQDARLELARQWGATHSINPKNVDPKKFMFDLTDGKCADVVVEISGSLRGLDTAVTLVREASLLDHTGRGKLLIPTLYGRDEKWSGRTGYALMFKAPILHSTHPRYAMDIRENYHRAIQAYIDDVLPIDRLVTHRYRLEDIAEAFEQLLSGKDGFLKGIIDFA
jgi:threonine dehydrogenase-like Zn-dependent dehydrogenase